MSRAVALTVCALLAAPASAQEPPKPAPAVVFPEGYVKPVRIDAGPFWRVHRFDLERIVDDRAAWKACVATRDDCQAKRLEDVTNPPEGLNMTWWQAAIAGVVTIVATLLAKKGVEEI